MSQLIDALLNPTFVMAGHVSQVLDDLFVSEDLKVTGPLTSAVSENLTTASRSPGFMPSRITLEACLTRSRMSSPEDSLSLSAMSGSGAAACMLPETSITNTMSQAARSSLGGAVGGMTEIRALSSWIDVQCTDTSVELALIFFGRKPSLRVHGEDSWGFRLTVMRRT